jgi:hypothetical protein
LLSGLLAAINPLLLWYSQETRAYSLMLLFGILALLFYELARAERGDRWWPGYVLAALFSFLLHKTGMIFCGVALLWHGREVLAKQIHWRSLWPHGLVFAAALGVLLMKSHPPLKELGRPSSILELGYTGMTFLGGYSFGPSLTEIQDFGPLHAVSLNPIQVGMLIIVLGLMVVLALMRGRAFFRSKEMILLLLGVGIVAVASLVSAFPFNVRYTLPALFGFLGLVSLLIAGEKHFMGLTLLSAVLSVALWADYQWFYRPAYRKGDSRAVAKWLTDHQDQVRTWTVLPDYLINSLEFYLPPDSQVRKNMMPSTGPQKTDFPPVPDALILGRRHHLVEPGKLISDYRAAAGQVRESKEFTGFEIYAREKGTHSGP